MRQTLPSHKVFPEGCRLLSKVRLGWEDGEGILGPHKGKTGRSQAGTGVAPRAAAPASVRAELPVDTRDVIQKRCQQCSPDAKSPWTCSHSTQSLALPPRI